MSSRERWTVYPLLFLTLGIALKDKVTRTVDTDQVTCRQLLVTDQLGNSRVVIGSTPQGGVATMEGVRRGVDVSLGHFSNQRSGLLITDANQFPIQGLLVPSTARATPLRRPAAEPETDPTVPAESGVDTAPADDEAEDAGEAPREPIDDDAAP